MRFFRSARWLLWALLLPLIPVSQAHAGVFISVGIAPPPLPVYVQPPCPEPDLMWVPGYWAYDYDAQSYYWVPGAWVPAPYEGALWTPPYWGWDSDVYVFHPGYWGHEVGYYGGVNYGFGYLGIGFVGGRWHERHFEYNTAVVHVNETVIHTTYIDRTVIHEHEVVHDSRVAYAGGPGGIHHDPLPEERRAMQVAHLPPTHFQEQHIQQARSDRTNFFNVNHGRPQTVALARPLPAERHEPPAINGGQRPPVMGAPANNGGQRPPVMGSPANNGGQRGDYRVNPQYRPQVQQQPAPMQRPDARPQPPVMRPQSEARPVQPEWQPRSNAQPRPDYRQAPEQRPQPQSRPAPEPRYQPQSRPAPEPRYQPQARPAPEPRYQPQARPAPEPRSAPEARPQPHQESRPAPESHHDSRQPKR